MMIYCEGIENSKLCLKCDRKYCVLEEDTDYMQDRDDWDEYYKENHLPEYEDLDDDYDRYGCHDLYGVDNFYDGENDKLIDVLKEYQNQEMQNKAMISALEANITVVKTYESDPYESNSNSIFEELLKKFIGD